LELVRFRPRRDVLNVHDEMDRAFDHLLRSWLPDTSYAQFGWAPSIDVVETDDEFIVKAEMPGVQKEDIDLSVVDGQLIISGEKRQEEEKEGKDYYRAERCYGSFRRVFGLPSRVDVEKVRASHKDGVLTVNIPKAGEAKTTKIDIEVK
jgi:HSP20 family protein